jgi:hypothetical protein
MTTAHQLQEETATEWVSFPFTYAGKSFNSKVKAKTRKLQDIQNLPAGIFASLNEQCLTELATITASTTREHDLAELERLSAGSSWAILELAGE